MIIQKSTIESDYKLVTYNNGVQYVVYHSASWPVGDEIGTTLKNKFFQDSIELNSLNVNEAKHKLLDELTSLESTIANKLRILRSFDQDDSHSGCYDLQDQLISMERSLSDLSKVTLRAKKIVPSK